jgi:hypothetical protein
MTLEKFTSQHPHLFWYIKDLRLVSPELALEQVLNYGDFKDVKLLFKILGTDRAANIFGEQIKKERCNYRPEIKNYFKLYFEKYASKNFK